VTRSVPPLEDDSGIGAPAVPMVSIVRCWRSGCRPVSSRMMPPLTEVPVLVELPIVTAPVIVFAPESTSVPRPEFVPGSGMPATTALTVVVLPAPKAFTVIPGVGPPTSACWPRCRCCLKIQLAPSSYRCPQTSR